MPMSRLSAEVRLAFLDFFKRQRHEVVASSALVPQSDPTLMFTNAGMVQFKEVFVGNETRPYTRAASCQKCIRISGKHNDLENVGVTARHHTFFEMLGNFSFGDYFKEEAIAQAWELLTKVYDLDPARLMVTVFDGDRELAAQGVGPDDEARSIWKKVTGFGDERIVGLGTKDNFWQMGETGPCGPCTEIHWFNGDVSGAVPYGTYGSDPSSDGRGWTEIWNLVFMQFERAIDSSGNPTLTPLPKPCVDTGAGLERVSSVLQGVTSNYETDLLRALVDKVSSISGKPYVGSQSDDDVSMRVIADHARTTAFLISEGIFPDRAGREYVLRRVMRRAVRHGHRLGIREPFLHEVALEVVRLMGDQYPELPARRELVANVTRQEEQRFRETIERGLKNLEDEIERVRLGGGSTLSGEKAFKLYDTYGFPLDLTQVIAQERGITVDEKEYGRALEQQRSRSEASKLNDAVAVEHVWRDVQDAVSRSPSGSITFVGYDREEAEGRVVAIVKERQLAMRAIEGEKAIFVTDVTPFYAESGGQVGDVGIIERRGVEPMRFRVEDTVKPAAGLVAHVGVVARGAVAIGDTVHLQVDHELRSATRRNHTATHLLHWALRTVLGEQANQKGSLVSADRLRFDFAHNRALAADEIARIEDLVNLKLLTDAPVITEVLPMAEARKRGAIAIFEEKYGEVVRMLTMTSDSVELCGGTHARSLGELGLFKIVSEQGLAAGVRRIEATTGMNALAYLRSIEGSLRSAARIMKSSPTEVTERIERLLEHEKQLEKELGELRRRLATIGEGGGAGAGGLDELLRAARDIPGGKALAAKVAVADAATLREVAENLRDKLGSAVVLVGAVRDDKAMLVLTVSKTMTNRYNAGDLVKGVAQMLGGSGGGRPDMAQAGGTQPDRLDEALASLYARLS
ncbi:MAG: alanine--tRNA ligase [Myxococcota bacterium]|nr:alanine--tRNA ligase [Myxococcota bacterium]